MLDLSSGSYPYVTSSTLHVGGRRRGSADSAAGTRRRASRAQGLLDASGSGTVPDRALRLHGRVPPRARQRVRHLDRPPRRTGWFDAVVSRTAVELSGADAIAITKLDVLDELAEIPVCVGYRLDGRDISDVPALVEDIERVEPVYETLPGWRSKTTGVTRYEELPDAARRYVAFLEKKAGASAVFIATGPRREETVWRSESPFLADLPSRVI